MAISQSTAEFKEAKALVIREIEARVKPLERRIIELEQQVAELNRRAAGSAG